MKLTNPCHVATKTNTRSYADERRRVDWHVYEYQGSDGEQYRKSFETGRDAAPVVPESGTHQEINAVKIQWEAQ